MGRAGIVSLKRELEGMSKELSGDIMEIIELLVPDGSQFISARKQVLDATNGFQRKLEELLQRKYEVSLIAQERIVVEPFREDEN